MNRSIPLMAIVALGFCVHAIAQQPESRQVNVREQNIRTILEIFRLIEERTPESTRREVELVDANVEMNWPASLPYGGSFRGATPRPDRPSWGQTWTPLQPTPAERKMDPRVVAASDNEVVVLYHQRGLSRAGDRYDGEVLGLYEMRDGKLARAQMFYFDEAGAVAFLAKAKEHWRESK